MMLKDLKKDSLIEQEDYDHTANKDTIQRLVVVSVDPDSAQYVSEWAIREFVRRDTDMVVLVHVRPFDVPIAPFVDGSVYMDELVQQRDDSHRFLRAVAHKFWHHNIVCKAISMMGDPKVEIIRKATEIHAEALIMGSRRLGTIKRALLGSVSDYCSHNSPCTVLIVKEPPSEQAKKQAIARLVQHAR
ncbi:hypothetical protein BX666DRAFT_1936076 [Dichotomocladium elegans]|nr:hypothetical protein BX666DRAFT_1936076 [Dichotomocladium elegans]